MHSQLDLPQSTCKVQFKCRWADCDLNGHMRHTAFGDYCAQARVDAFEQIGHPLDSLMKLQIGPVLFAEDIKYKKEIQLGETFEVISWIGREEDDGRKWWFEHRVITSSGEVACSLGAHGSWLDLAKRKVTSPPKEIWTSLKSLVRKTL